MNAHELTAWLRDAEIHVREIEFYETGAVRRAVFGTVRPKRKEDEPSEPVTKPNAKRGRKGPKLSAIDSLEKPDRLWPSGSRA